MPLCPCEFVSAVVLLVPYWKMTTLPLWKQKLRKRVRSVAIARIGGDGRGYWVRKSPFTSTIHFHSLWTGVKTTFIQTLVYQLSSSFDQQQGKSKQLSYKLLSINSHLCLTRSKESQNNFHTNSCFKSTWRYSILRHLF